MQMEQLRKDMMAAMTKWMLLHKPVDRFLSEV